MKFHQFISLIILIFNSKIGDGSLAETKLFTDLLKGYNPLERPVQNSSEPLEVKIKLFLQQILDVDEKNQIVSVNAWLSYTWFDHKLQWEPKKYGGIQDIRFPGSSDHIWKPDVLLYNSAAEDFDSTFKSNLLTYHTGTVVWIPPGVLKFVCQLDVTWFPFDDQVCEMKFGSWTFHGKAIDLQIDDDSNGRVFFSCCMLVVSASVVFTIVVLNLHFRSADSHEMNPVVRRVLLEFLPWLLFMSRPGYKFVKANVIDNTDKMPKKPKNPCNLPSNHAGYEAQILLLHSVHTELRKVVAFYNKEEHDERIQTDWRFAAMVVDRACLLLFTVFIVISILAIMMSAPHIIA
uniref:Neur_chan_LBD domain-containing protein n=1 Tax=Caenorhabditis tropicalis TaxID=1561998 RepID=A0A1I7U470_9PELO